MQEHRRLKTLIHEVSQLTLALIGATFRTANAGGADAEHRPHPGPDRPPLLPRSQRLDRRDPRPAVPADGGLPQAVPGVVGAELVPVQVGAAGDNWITS